MIILVCGGRDYNDRARLFSVLDEYAVDLIVQGGAKGADWLAADWARSREVPCLTHPARWSANGRQAGPLRNNAMLIRWHPDEVVAFPGGPGTGHMVGLARSKGFSVREVMI
jgi:hypothetical protein